MPWSHGKIAKVLCAVFAVAVLAACDGPEQREANHLDRGKAFFQEGNYSKARVEFRNVLQINSRSVEGRYSLGLVDEVEGNLRQAFTNFRQAAEQQPDHLPSLVKVGQYFLAGNRLDEVMEQAGVILALDPENADGHVLRGAVHLRRNELALARQEIDQALRADPANLAAVSALVGIERKAGKSEIALATLAKAIDQNPEESGLRLLQIQLLIEQGALGKAEEVYRSLTLKEPDNLGYKTSLAKLLIQQNRKDDAETYLRAIVVAAPQSPELKLLLVDFLFNQRGFAEAETALLGFVEQSPAELMYRFSLAELYLRHEERAKAIGAYREIIELDQTGPKGLIARASLAKALMAQGDKEAARALVVEVLKEDPNDTEALFLRARDRLEGGDNEGAIADLRTLLRERPELAGGRALLAEAHLRNGEPTLAIEALRTLLELRPESQTAQVALARQLARQGEVDTALTMLREALGRDPNDLAALRVQAEVYSRQKNWPALIETATTIIVQTSEKALGYQIRGQAYLVQQQYVEAAADFVAVLETEPDALGPLVGLVRSYLGRDEGQEAKDLLLARLATSPDSAALHTLLGELYRTTGETGPAEAAFRAAIESRKDYAPAYANLASLSQQAGNVAEAIKIYRDGLAASPGDEKLSFALATALILEKDYAAAAEIYDAMLAGNSDLPAVANNLAALIADFQYEDSTQLARALELSKPFDTSRNPFFLDTLGWVHYRLGNIEQALSYLEQAVAKAPGAAQLQYHLGMAYHAAGQPEKARQALDLAVVDGADYPGLQTARATLAEM